jgi:hypothetical protein
MIKIEQNLEILNFLKECQLNILNEKKNTFLNRKVTLNTQSSIQEKMKEAGFHEFVGDKSHWPSLFYSTDSFKLNPYYQAVPFQSSKTHGVQVNTMTFVANRLFNLLSVVDDPNQSLNDSMVLRALDKPLTTNILMKNNEVWMMNVPSESMTIDPVAKIVSGRVLTFGLGIGYFVFMASLNPQVTSIDVVEYDLNVIEYFKEYLLPYFPKKINITIHHDDAKKWMSKSLIEYDHIFVDTYQNEQDGFYWWNKGCELIKKEHKYVHYWIEPSITRIMRVAMIAVFTNQKGRFDNMTHQCIEKIKAYFQIHDVNIQNVADLKRVLYNHQLYREIASTPVLNQAKTNQAKNHKSNP